jgi:hypothetical protein
MYSHDAQQPCINLTTVQSYAWRHLGNALLNTANNSQTNCALVGLSSSLLDAIRDPSEWTASAEATLSPAHTPDAMVRRVHVVDSPLTALSSVFTWENDMIYQLVDALSHRLPKWSEFRLSHFRTVRRRQLLQLWIEVQQWLTDVAIEHVQAEGDATTTIACRHSCLPVRQRQQLCHSKPSARQRLASGRVSWMELFDIDPQAARRVKQLGLQWGYFNK